MEFALYLISINVYRQGSNIHLAGTGKYKIMKKQKTVIRKSCVYMSISVVVLRVLVIKLS